MALLHVFSLASSPGGQADVVVARADLASETRQLFNLALVKPQRIRLVADVELTETPWTKEQISAELKLQNQFMQDKERWLSQNRQSEIQILRSNAIVRSHSGIRVLHVQEWYSGKHYRLDQTDEAVVTGKFLQSHQNGFHDTFVNIQDVAFSPYGSFSINHELHSALVSRDPNRRYHSHDLWRAMGLDVAVQIPLILALVDIHSVNTNQIHSVGSDDDLSRLRIDLWKLERIHNGSDPFWHLHATAESLEGIPVTRFTLAGKCPTPESSVPMSLIDATYWVAQVFGKTVCVQARLTNLTDHSSLLAKREDFDSKGFPRLWKTSTLKQNSPVSERSVHFKEIDLNPTFNDIEVFSPAFPTNYSVSDITSGTGVLLQNPHPEIPVARTSTLPSRRAFALAALALAVVVPPALVCWVRARKQNRE